MLPAHFCGGRASAPRIACWFLALAAFAAAPAYARQPVHASRYERARHLLDGLESKPDQQRTRSEYERVLDAYRAVYHGDPASPYAAASVSTVADLLAEEGRIFRDEKALHDAIGQYEFLRAQYPGSSYRVNGLLAEGEIYRRDLHDRNAAQQAFREFVKLYPRNPLAAEARDNLRSIREEEGARRSGSHRSVAALSAPERTSAPAARTALRRHESIAPTAVLPSRQTTEAPAFHETSLPRPTGKLPLVTNIRHWSTPVYTRVAIDLQSEVKYEASRVPNPDRVFFDLYGTRLSPQLKGRSVQVIDGGFLKRIRAAQFSNDVTRIVLDVSGVSEYSAFFLPDPPRLIIDVRGRKPGSRPSLVAHQTRHAASPHELSSASAQGGAAVAEIASLSSQPDRVKATPIPTTAPVSSSVAGTTPASQPDTFAASAPAPLHSVRHRTRRSSPPAQPTSSMDVVRPAEPTATGERSLVRTLGLKINKIVIDAGHGGHDSGTLGPGGIEEKDVVLDVALRLGKLLKQRLGADIIYTRDNDTFIPLETRTAIANKAQADLFISIHANSSSDPATRGVETYYLNFTSSPDALEVAARENAVSDESIHQLSELVKKIALQDKISESREFASDVQQSLYTGLEDGNPGLKDRGVKKAPFVVLIGANMPSILAEISFLTNPESADELREPAYRERIAESLYRGVARYINSLSGVRLAQAATLPSNR